MTENPPEPYRQRWPIIAILLLTVAVRLYHIDFPVGGFMAWRQADTAAMAKNYYLNGYQFGSPQIDWGGSSPGYVETEFPLFPFLIAALYKIFGMTELWGRILAVACSCATVFGLYKLVRLMLGEQTALWSAAIYAILPLNVFYGRAIMPDIMMLMCSVWGIYWFALWAETGRAGPLAASAAAIALAILLKLPELYLGLPLLSLAVGRDGVRFLRRGSLWAYALAVLIPAAFWYYHAHQTYLASGLTFGIWDFGSGKWGNISLLATPKFYNDVLFKSIAERHLTYPGFFLFIAGIILPWQRPGGRLFTWWLAGIAVYILIVARGNQVHEYYQLPFALPAAVFIGHTAAEVFSRDTFRFYRSSRRTVLVLVALCLFSLAVLSILRVANYMEGERRDGSVFQLGGAVQQATSPDDLLAAVDEGDPVVLYRCGRRGWHIRPDELTPELLEQLHFAGASFCVGTTDLIDTPERQKNLLQIAHTFPIVAMNGSYFIIRLSATDVQPPELSPAPLSAPG